MSSPEAATSTEGNSIDRSLLRALLEGESRLFRETHPKSEKLFQRAQRSLQGGVPMLWMRRWPGTFPVYAVRAKGARLVDVDGHEYLDFCLGDTGALTGHAPDEVVKILQNEVPRGLTMMLPSEDSLWVGEELTRRFKLSHWQFTLTATDANRFALRMARHVTRRPKVLVFNYCYHGTVDESFIVLAADGRMVSRHSNLGPQIDPVQTSKVVEFNDVAALEEALSARDVAAVLAEPVMTNIGIVPPAPGFHEALRRLTRKYGTLLILDETHTISAGPGGCTALWGLEPDLLTIGKPLAGGLPAAVYGCTEAVSRGFAKRLQLDDADVGGIGGTLSGNVLSIKAMRATLEHILTPKFYEHGIALQQRFTAGIEEVIREYNLPWIVKSLGVRCEYWFCPTVPKNGGEAFDAIDHELDAYMHLFALNRGILMTPFHNMALICPDVSVEDVNRHTEVFREAVVSLLGNPKAKL